MTNLKTNFKTTNSIDKKATIFAKLDAGISLQEIANWAEISVSTVKSYYLVEYRKMKGTNRVMSPIGSKVLKTIKAYAFDLVKVDSMNNIIIDGKKFPIMSATSEEVSYAGIENGDVVIKSVNAIDFKSNGYRLSK